MRHRFIAFVLILASCDYGAFDKDKRQIIAKDYVREHLPRRSFDFDIAGFREDTISPMLDSNFKHVISYTLDYHFRDSLNQLQQKQTTVLFTPDGHSVITSINQP